MFPIQFERTVMLIGQEGYQKLAASKVMIFGLGGVGAYTVEALARAGIGNLVLIDYDYICATNINRQIPALHSTVGRLKTEVLKERILDINPSANVRTYEDRLTKDNCFQFFQEKPDYIVDAIDTMLAKVSLLFEAKKRNVPIVSSMGAGNKLDPTKFKVADISKTHTCPVAKIVRKELRNLGIKEGIKTVFSEEQPKTPHILDQSCLKQEKCLGEWEKQNKKTAASISFVPSVAGLLLASIVVNDLLSFNGGDLFGKTGKGN